MNQSSLPRWQRATIAYCLLLTGCQTQLATTLGMDPADNRYPERHGILNSSDVFPDLLDSPSVPRTSTAQEMKEGRSATQYGTSTPTSLSYSGMAMIVDSPASELTPEDFLRDDESTAQEVKSDTNPFLTSTSGQLTSPHCGLFSPRTLVSIGTQSSPSSSFSSSALASTPAKDTAPVRSGKKRRLPAERELGSQYKLQAVAWLLREELDDITLRETPRNDSLLLAAYNRKFAYLGSLSRAETIGRYRRKLDAPCHNARRQLYANEDSRKKLIARLSNIAEPPSQSSLPNSPPLVSSSFSSSLASPSQANQSASLEMEFKKLSVAHSALEHRVGTNEERLKELQHTVKELEAMQRYLSTASPCTPASIPQQAYRDALAQYQALGNKRQEQGNALLRKAASHESSGNYMLASGVYKHAISEYKWAISCFTKAIEPARKLGNEAFSKRLVEQVAKLRELQTKLESYMAVLPQKPSFSGVSSLTLHHTE
ncbi:MAG: hypothetical protein AAFP93_00405 [Bacteroidota bacterium]